MACADVNFDLDIQAEEEPQQPGQEEAQVLQYYQATEFIPDKKGPFHELQKTHPAMLGSMQIVSGLLSIGVGIVFAVTENIHYSLFTLFRVSQMTGALFISAGLVSNLLCKYPALLTVSLVANCSCIFVAMVAACLITVDLALWGEVDTDHQKMEVMGLCVLGLEAVLSVVLCLGFIKEKRAKSL